MNIQGITTWAVIVGTPRANKFKGGAREWSFDLTVNEVEQKKLLDAGMKATYLKNKDDSRGTYITFVRPELKKDGTPSKPFNIVDAQKNPWPSDKLIGNGSVLNVIVSLNEREFRGVKFLKPSAVAVQIWDHKDYVSTSNGSGGGFASKEAVPGDSEGTW